jgi:adenylate cyclase
VHAVPGDDAAALRRQAALDHVRARLLEAGATDDEVDAAVAADVLDLLAADRLLIPAPRRYTRRQVMAATGMPDELLRRLWRALGFLDVGEDEPAFTDFDIEAVRLFQGLVALGASDAESAVQMARVIGSSMARIAEAEVQPDAGGPVAGTADSVLAADAFTSVADSTLPAMARLVEFVWRRHVQAALRRTMLQRLAGSDPGASHPLTVGFADMVGFTLLSQHVSEVELASVVRRFEELAHDIVTGLGGRVVKMIGDEVMFVVDDVLAAARIGLGLAEAYAKDELLSDVRVGLAVGPVLIREGDHFGPTVNLAHRIVSIANPGSVLVSDEFRTELDDVGAGEFSSHPLRPRTLKGLGRVQLWWLGRAGQDPRGSGDAVERRRTMRWERLAEILPELEELRDVGERVMSGARRRPDAAGDGDGDGDGDGADEPAGGKPRPAGDPASAAGQPDGGDAMGA